MSETKPTHLLIKTRPKGTQNPWSEAVVSLRMEERYKTLASRNGWEIETKPCILVEKTNGTLKYKEPLLILTEAQRQTEIQKALAEEKAAKERVAALMKGLDKVEENEFEELEELQDAVASKPIETEEKSFGEKMKEAKIKKSKTNG